MSSNVFAQNIQNQDGDSQKQSQQKIDINNNSQIKNSILIDKIEGNLSNVTLTKKDVTSLMFDDQEQDSINQAIEALRSGNLYLPQTNDDQEDNSHNNENSYVYLASILYINENLWAVWLNGEKITHENNIPGRELYITSLQKDKVSVLWTLSATKWKILIGKRSEEMESKINERNQVEVEFELKPNQTYILLNNSTVEGNAISNAALAPTIRSTTNSTNKLSSGFSQ